MLSKRTKEQNERLLELATHLQSGQRKLAWRFNVYHMAEIPGVSKECGCAIGEWVVNPGLEKPPSADLLMNQLVRATTLLEQKALVETACEWFGLSDREYRCCFTSCASHDESRGGAWLSIRATPEEVAGVLHWVASGKPELFRNSGEVFTLRQIADQPDSVPWATQRNINRLPG